MAEKETRNIYARMAAVKSKLLGIKKGGKSYSYSYFELGDILPVLTPALAEERLFMKTQFSATDQVAKLIIIDIDAPESQIEFEIKFVECALKGAHEIQNLGAAQTYTRRYLIMTAFDIAESDIVDAGAEKDEKKETQNRKPPASKSQQPPPAKNNPPQPPAVPQEDIKIFQRQTWELIKKLPEKAQTEWINSCKRADAEKLKGFIKELTTQLETPPQETAPEEPAKTQGQQLADEAAQETAPEDRPAQEQDEVTAEELEIF